LTFLPLSDFKACLLNCFKDFKLLNHNDPITFTLIRHRLAEDGWQRQHHHHRGCDCRLRGGPPHPYRRHHPHLPQEKAERQM